MFDHICVGCGDMRRLHIARFLMTAYSTFDPKMGSLVEQAWITLLVLAQFTFFSLRTMFNSKKRSLKKVRSPSMPPEAFV